MAKVKMFFVRYLHCILCYIMKFNVSLAKFKFRHIPNIEYYVKLRTRQDTQLQKFLLYQSTGLFMTNSSCP